MKKILYLLMLPLLVGACKSNNGSQNDGQESAAYQRVSPEFCVDSAYAYIEKQCSYGPRTMNSQAHDLCGEWIQQKFESLGATVKNQFADLKLYDGTPIKSRNIIAQINPEADVRIMICSHWDSRPWADHDSDESKYHTPIDGANDGASGVAVMMEIARQIQMLGDTCGVKVGLDLVCFDAEDCGTPEFDMEEGQNEDPNTWCLGSQYWAEMRIAEGYSPKYGILLDMVGGVNSYFKREYYSMRYAPTVVSNIWNTAHLLGHDNLFLDEDGGGITDDHLQVIKSGIPCVDLIGCDVDGASFPKTWHTMNDDIHHIDKNILKAVGQVLMEVIWKEK